MRLGVRVIEEGADYKVIKFPMLVTENMLQRAAENVRRDAAILGVDLEITIGHRLLRIEGDLAELRKRGGGW